MRTIIIISLVLVLPAILLAQQTYVPDDNFEQALIDEGYDTPPLNDSVPTANINTVLDLRIRIRNILDLTGIEDFTALEYLNCSRNNIKSLDLSNNYALDYLGCYNNDLIGIDLNNNVALRHLQCEGNNLTSLDVSKNSNLEILTCGKNNLTSLDLSNNTILEQLHCADNELINLDLSNNTILGQLYCERNYLTSLNIRNGNNYRMAIDGWFPDFNASGNPDLYCIQVDDSTWSSNAEIWIKDAHAVYSEDCTKVGVDFRAEDGNDNISISSSPNPFSNSTNINYTIENPAMVRIDVYDNLGQEITTLVDEFKDAGEHQAQFNAENLPQGIYFYKIQIDNATESGHLLLIK